MATARIAAGLVLAAATDKQTKIEARCAEWRAAQIANVRREPQVTGPFWRRTIRVLTAEQAEVEYDRLVEVCQTRQWWDELKQPNDGLGFSKKAQQLARAALIDGDGLVTLDADEIRFLGLGAQS